ncbi:MAG: hypothetical protein R3C68_05255 [Myxococcota bacterium]
MNAEWGGDAPGSRALISTGVQDTTYTLQYVVGSEEPAGFVSFGIDLVNEAGVISQFQQPRALELDFDAPALLNGTEQIMLTPPETTLLTSVESATAGTVIELFFAVNELLGDVPILTTTPSNLPFVCDPPLGTFYRCELLLSDDALTVDGDYSTTAFISDIAGNTTNLSLPGFTVDLTAPAVPRVDVAGQVLYERVPYGSDETQGRRVFSIGAQDGAVEPGAHVIVFDGVEIASSSELGRSRATTQGSVNRFEIASANRPRVYLVAVDAAGNASDAAPATAGLQAALIRDVTWRATLTGKVAGSLFENPHRLYRRRWLGAGLSQPDAVEISDGGALGRIDQATEQTMGAGDWTLASSSELPSSATEFVVAYDSWRAVAVYVRFSSNPMELWEWNGDVWSQRAFFLDPEGDGDPVARDRTDIAFDSQRGEVVLFGGRNNTVLRNDTWIWNGTSWRQALPATRPPARAFHRMAYDESRDRTVLFGGDSTAASGGGELNDVWEWDGHDWRQVVPPTSPPARSFAMLTYDDARRVVVMHGGFGYAPTGSTDCGAGAVASAPGGFCNFNDTWTWDGSTWSMRCDSSSVTSDCAYPPISGGAAMAYDQERAVVVMFGGTGVDCSHPEGLCDETWEWNGQDWSKRLPADVTGDGSPNARIDSQFVYDSHRNQLLLIGGDNEFDGCDGAPSCGDVMWRWDGSDWTQRLNTRRALPLSGARSDPGLAYDQRRDNFVFFGGRINGISPLHEDITWSFDGLGWTETPAATPNGRQAPVMVYNVARDRTLLFGGIDHRLSGFSDELADTWEWNGSSWSQINSLTVPPPRESAAYAYDSANQVVMMYGGRDGVGIGGSCPDGEVVVGSVCYLDDTWGFGVWGLGTCGSAKAACWRNLSNDGPGRGYGQEMAFDERRGVMVMFGGRFFGTAVGSGEVQNTTWEWNGSAWEVVDVGSIPGRTAHAMTYDESRAKVVVVGGSIPEAFGLCPVTADSLCNDVWEWDGSKWEERLISDPTGDGQTRPRSGHALAYNNAEGRTYLIDGTSNTFATTETTAFFWRWDGGANVAPGQTAEFSLAQTGEPNATAKVIEVRWVAGGVGFPLGTQRFGAGLSFWQGGHWQEVTENTASSQQPGELSLCLYDPAQLAAPPSNCTANSQLRRLPLGTRQSVYVSARAAHPNGTGLGIIATDYVELTASYNIP